VAFRTFRWIFWFPTIPNSMIIVDNLHRDLNMSALFPQTHKCKLIAILVSQDEKLDLSSKFFKCRKALMRDSWSTSSASCQFFTMRYARCRILLEWRLLSSTKGNSVSRFRCRDQQLFTHLVQAALDGKDHWLTVRRVHNSPRSPSARKKSC